MCIALISTAHPAYELIIIDNRDEYLHRPTAPANWWKPPNTHVLGSRDLARSEQGTWMGITRQGRVAVLTNYREAAPVGVVSRGAIVNDFLMEPPFLLPCLNAEDELESKMSARHSPPRCTRAFVQEMIQSQTAHNAGGFSLVCGKVGEPLAIVSNRMSNDIESATWIAANRGETVGLSNTFLKDRTWPKIINGERLMREAIDDHLAAFPHLRQEHIAAQPSEEEEEDLIQRLFQILSTDTMPRLAETEPLSEQYMDLLKESIFIPLLGDRAKYEAEAEQLAKMGLAGYTTGLYGTQKQTVILVHRSGRVKYIERSLYDDHVHPIPLGKGDRVFEFEIEGWKEDS